MKNHPMTLPRWSRLLGAVLPLVVWRPALAAPVYDLLIKGGHLIDARNGVDAELDLAIAGGKVAAVGANLPVEGAKTVVQARGLVVTPGLVDIHTHVFHGVDPDGHYSNGFRALPPDGFTFRAGVTTVVDAGGSGWRNFLTFKRQVIDVARTRVLAMLNIVGAGMVDGPAEENLADMDPRLTALQAHEFPQIVVGIKTAHFRGPEWTPVDRAVEAGRMANIPVMVDFGEFVPERPWRDLVTRHLRPGDIYTHFFLPVVPLLDGQGHVQRYVLEARKRGVIFDVGHGGGSFVFRQAVPAMKQGVWPDSISTDLHVASMNGGMKDMSNLMSKFLAMGMPLKEVIARSTDHPAREIRRADLGHLGVGAVADVAVFGVRKGSFGFVDVEGGRLQGAEKLECELTVRAGEVVWDLDGISRPEWQKQPPRNEPLDPWPPPAQRARH
jgi:dihydroorotase